MRRMRVVREVPAYRVMLAHESNIRVNEDFVQTPGDSAKIASDYLRGADREHFVGLYLNAANRLIALHTISVGTLNSSLVHPREVYKVAILVNAASVIVCHNHSSGNVEPSPEDIAITAQLLEAGKILGIPLLDHIIVSEGDGYVSCAERGLI